MRDDLYPANETVDGAGLIVVALVVAFVVAIGAYNWLVNYVAGVL